MGEDRGVFLAYASELSLFVSSLIKFFFFWWYVGYGLGWGCGRKSYAGLAFRGSLSEFESMEYESVV